MVEFELTAVLFASRSAGPVEHALVALLGMLGLRVFEACAADISDIRYELATRSCTAATRALRRVAKAAGVHLQISQQAGPHLLHHRPGRRRRAARRAIRDVPRRPRHHAALRHGQPRPPCQPRRRRLPGRDEHRLTRTDRRRGPDAAGRSPAPGAAVPFGPFGHLDGCQRFVGANGAVTPERLRLNTPRHQPPARTPVRPRATLHRWATYSGYASPHTAMTFTKSSRPLKSSRLRVYSWAPWAWAVAAISRSIARARGLRPRRAVRAASCP